MSRWTAFGADRGEHAENNDEKRVTEGKNHLLDRRGFLRTAGAGLAAAAGLAGTAAAADYRTITLSPGETRTFRVGNGETFENTLFDISASGAVARLIIDGADTTVRNVAWSGAQDTESYAVFTLGNATAGSTLIENIYMGDGSTTGASAGQRDPTAIWANGGASGDVTIRNVNVQNWGDNGMYLSSASNLDVTIEGCYAANNPNAEYRLEGGTVRDSVVRNAYARGVWGFGPGTTNVENCHIHAPGASAFWAGEASAGGSTINVSNTEFSGDVSEPHGTTNLRSGNGNDPQDFYPQGCPTSAVEAASGGGSDGSGGGSSGDDSDSREETGPFEHTLLVDSPDGSAEAEYEIVTSGRVARGDDLEDHDAIAENNDGTWTITGMCSDGWTDSYTFEGEVVDYAVSGGRLNLVVDGATINPLDAHNLRVHTPDGGDVARYEITTTGEITRGSRAEPSSDHIDENGDGTWTVAGVSGDGYADTFEFRGSLEDYSTSGGRVAIVVDGETVKSMAPATSTLRVEIPEPAGVVRYEVTATGEITAGDEAEWSDRIEDNGDGTWTVSGICGGGYVDTFEVAGEVDDCTADGPATFSVDGEEHAVVDSGPSTMRIQTPDGGDVVRYEITTTGEIVPGEEAEWTDRVSENGDGTWTVSGVSGDGYADTFEFTGSIESVDYTGGEMSLLVDGDEVRL